MFYSNVARELPRMCTFDDHRAIVVAPLVLVDVRINFI